jgi:nucleoside-diphosphate-sugar epimerase
MKLLITGGAGFVGSRLARSLLTQGSLGGQKIDKLVIADQYAPPDFLLKDPRVEARTAPLLAQCATLHEDRFDGVFHLASAVSGECEDDFDLGMRSNLDTTRALLDALKRAGNKPRFVFSSSIAVFGPDPAHPMPDIVTDETLAMPQTSYGTHKLMCELLIADYTRKCHVDGRSARLMTVTVRPGTPNGAASSFFSGIIREPLAGKVAICPVPDTVSHPLSSTSLTVQGLIAVYAASREEFLGRSGINLPALNVTVKEMLEALEAVAGPKARSLVKFEFDERIANIVSNWPKGAASKRAHRLGLHPAKNFASIIEEYIQEL